MHEILSCPICNLSLQFNGLNSYICDKNHTFDLSKEGYLNLLPVQKKSSINPGDGLEMVRSRRAFLDKGHYQFLVKEITEMLKRNKLEHFHVADVGCGEGYYSGTIFNQEVFSPDQVYGIDISKHAVKYAARRYKENFYITANVKDIPIKSACIDIVLSVFSPISELELHRILKPQGVLIMVLAGEIHLEELAKQIYTNFRKHNYNPVEKLEKSFELIEDKSIEKSLQLTNREDVSNLFKMTPYYWAARQDVQEKFLTVTEFETTCSFTILLFRKK